MKHHWCGKPSMEKTHFGFIYQITNLINGRMYVGKKQYSFHRYKKIEGKKRRTKVVLPSHWEEYTGSSKELNKDIKKYGKENFDFQILWNCSTNSMLFWMEIKELVTRDVLLQRLEGSEIPLYYNRAIPGIKFIPVGYCE